MTEKNKKEDKAIQEQYPIEVINKLVLGFTSDLKNHPDKIIKDLQALIPQYQEGSKEEQAELNTKIQTRLQQMMLVNGTETHFPVMDAVGEDYRAMAVETAKNLITEFECKTKSEKALAQIAAMEYTRAIELAARMRQVTDIEYLSSEKNGYYGMVGRELDRAERRFQSAISTLKYMKAPTMKIQFNAQNAFVAQNQQINTAPSGAKDKPKNDGKIIDAE